MSRYLQGVVWIVFTTAVLLTSSLPAKADNQLATGGLYRDSELVDSFVEPLPSLESSAKAAAHTLDSVPASRRSQIFRQGVQPSNPGEETQNRNRAFARAAEAGAKLRELLLRMSAREGEDQEVDRQSLQALLQEFEATHAEVREALNRIGDRVIELGLDQSVHERHLEAVRSFVEGSKELRAAIKDVIDDKPDALLQALDVMQRLKFRDDPPLLNSGLPFQKHVLEAPRLTRQQADAAQEAEKPVAKAQADILVADMAIAPPTPDDLAETPDIKFTPEITAKAAELGNSPLAIYEFVRNKVSFEAYLGSRKGAANTLEQLRGNDTDQASLLLALLRVSGIPSRYVRGTVEMPPEPAMSWLGVDNAAKAASILTTAGLDGVAIVNGLDVVAIRSTHVWVEAYLPYANYRGIPNDTTGKTWVTLDPSFKGNDITPGEDVLALMGFDVDSFIAGYISTVSDPDPLEQLELNIQAYLDANDPGKTVADIERKRRAAPQLLGFLPGSTPYSVRSISGRFSVLEDSKRYKVRFHLYDGITDFIDYTIDLPELAGKRLTIEYVGATAIDQDTIDSFGGIYETPPNLVDVKPVLELDGVAIATASNSIGMGYTHSSDMQFIQPVGAQNVQPLVQNEIIAGNGQAIGFDTFLDVHDSFLGGDTFPAEDFLEAILHATACDYLSRVDRGMEKAERLMRVVTTQDVSEAIVENAISVSFSFGIPVTFKWTGLTVDADRRIIGTFDVDGDSSQDLPYMKLTGIHGSLMENRVFEEMFDQDAVSTVKILQLASEAEIGICTIQTSVYGECPGITQPSYIISALNSALSQGHVITIPEDPITVSQWSGTGYIDLDPTTGAGGYIISGGISGVVQTDAGGATVETWPVNLPCEATSVTGNVLDPAADSPDPSAVFCADATTLSFKVEFTTTCEDGTVRTHQQTFTTSKTKAEIGGGNYTLQLVAFGSTTIIRKITIVGVEKLEASEGAEWDDGDGSNDTNTVVLKKDTSGDVTVTATPNPALAEANLPGCWSLSGGTGTGKLSRTVSKTTAAKTTIMAISGASEKVMDVVVAKAKFACAPTEDTAGNKYGYDEMVAAIEDDDHVSVMKSGSTHVSVVLEGGIDRKYLKFVPVNDSVAKVTDPGSGTDASFLLEIKGQSVNTGETEIKIHAAQNTGPEISKIAVNVYQEIALTPKYFNVFKDGDPGTKVSPAPSGLDISTRANELLKAYVANLTVGAPTDKGIAFDLNGNGKLDFYNSLPNDEYDKVIADLKADGAGFADIAVMKDSFPDRWHLDSSITASVASPVTKFKVAGGASLINMGEQWSIELPNGDNSETFTIVAINGNELTIDKDLATPGNQGLTQNHAKTIDPKTSETLVASHTVGGLGNNIPADRPALIVGASANHIGYIAAHEQSHGQSMSDVNVNTNVMHCTTSTVLGNLPFRFKQLQRVVTGVCGTNKPGMDNQWETPARP